MRGHVRLRSKCFKLSCELYARFIEDVENRIRHHDKSFWSFVNKSKKSYLLPDVMYLRDRSASCRKSICNLLADQFRSVFTSDILPPLALCDCSSLLISMQIEYEELISALSKLDDNVNSGPDMIPSTSLSVASLLSLILYSYFTIRKL